MRSFCLTISLALFVPLAGGCLEDGSRAASQDVGIKVLKAIDYADLTRVVIRKDCRRNPSLAAKLPACAKIDSVPDSAIEAMALPHFLAYVTEEDAKAALAFWGTPEGARISRTLVHEIAEDNPDLLTQSELRSLDSFNKSKAGRAMASLAQDREASVAIIRAIGAYVPYNNRGQTTD
jgi:hypothetical protein